MAFLVKGQNKVGNILEQKIQTITYEEYLAHKAEIEASGKMYLVEGEVDAEFKAEKVQYDNSTSGLEAKSVQGAIDEIKNSLSQISSIYAIYSNYIILKKNNTYFLIGAVTSNTSAWNNVTPHGEVPAAIMPSQSVANGIFELNTTNRAVRCTSNASSGQSFAIKWTK